MDLQSCLAMEPLKEAEKQIAMHVAEQELRARGVLLGSCPGCGATRDVRACSCCPFVVSPAGYTKTGDGTSGVPLFSFTVTDLTARTFYITKSREDFEVLHRQLTEWTPAGTPELPKLPGKKMINANTHAHLRKRVGRLAEYLQGLLVITNVSRTPLLSSFLTDEALHGGLRAATGLNGYPTEESVGSASAGAGRGGEAGGHTESYMEKSWLDLDDGGYGGLNEEEADALRAEVQRLRRRVVLLERTNRAWSHTLQHLLHATIFHPRRKDENRSTLEKLMVNAVAENPSGKVSGVECLAVRTPSTVDGVPWLHLKQADGPVSVWGLRLDKGNCGCDLKLKGKKLGFAFECTVSLTMGLLGEVELVIAGGDRPSASVRFTEKPRIEVRTSGTKVTWGSLPVPMQEAVSAEIEEHSMRLLRAKLDPPGSINFELGDTDLVFDGDDAVHVSNKEKGEGPAGKVSKDSVNRGMIKPQGSGKSAGNSNALLPGVVREESIGLMFQRVKTGGEFVVSEVLRGGLAERTSMIRAGDLLSEVGKDEVSRVRVEVLRALLRWPPGCDRAIRLVQLTLCRGKHLFNVNLEQKAPLGPAARAGLDDDGLPEGWEFGARHEMVILPMLGLELEISGLDGLTRIRGFLPGGPAEQAELLFEGDEVCEMNGQLVPVGISAACARLQRIMESEGIMGKYVQVSVRRKSSWGVSQVSHVNVWCKPSPEEESEDWQVLDSSSDFEDSTDEEDGITPLRNRSAAAARKQRASIVRSGRREASNHSYQRAPAPPPSRGAISSMSSPQQLFQGITNLVSEAIDAAIP